MNQNWRWLACHELKLELGIHICHPFNFVPCIFVFGTSFNAHPSKIKIVNEVKLLYLFILGPSIVN